MIRVIQIVTVNRSLLKGHNHTITDIRFFSSKSNRMASVDQGGEIIIWDIAQTTNERGETGYEYVSTNDFFSALLSISKFTLFFIDDHQICEDRSH